MNDLINAAIALVMLATLAIQLAGQHPDRERPGGFNLRALGRTLVGVYLASVALFPLTRHQPEGAQTALLVGLTLLLLVRWRRKEA